MERNLSFPVSQSGVRYFYFLVAMPVVRDDLLSLSLPEPTAVNCGGFLLQDPVQPAKTIYAYSPIDLLVCGLEHNDTVTNLTQWFDKQRGCILSLEQVYMPICAESISTGERIIINKTISNWILYIKYLENNNKEVDSLCKLLVRNAPLSFKWR
jgi:hypothetical protein